MTPIPEDVLNMLWRLLPFVEDAKEDPCLKPGHAAAVEKELRALLKRVTPEGTR